MIQTMVPPKPGRLATGSYGSASPIRGSVFGDRPRDNASLMDSGGLAMKNDRTATIYNGSMSDYHNTATQREDPALTADLVPIAHAPNIQPQERGTFFQKKIFPVDNMKFGGSKTDPSDTTFHPMPERKIRSVTGKSAHDGAHVSTVSFPSHNNLWSDPHNSFIGGRTTAGNPGNVGVGRWALAKKGAAS